MDMTMAGRHNLRSYCEAHACDVFRLTLLVLGERRTNVNIPESLISADLDLLSRVLRVTSAEDIFKYGGDIVANDGWLRMVIFQFFDIEALRPMVLKVISELAASIGRRSHRVAKGTSDSSGLGVSSRQ